MERTRLSGLVVTLVLSLAGVHSNAGVGAGGAITSPNIGQEGTLDVFIGNGSRQVVSLDVATNTWTAVGFAPAPIGAGGSLSNLFNSCDYAFAGAQSTAFFSTGGITWLCQNQRLADAPAPVGAGGALAAAPGLGGAPVDHVFALRGGGTEDFWRYSIGQDSWTALPLTPATVGDGGGLVEFYSNGAICSTSSFSVAALRGDFTSDFWCFNIDQNRWEAGPSTPAPVGPGGALAQLQGLGHIYALRGGGTEDFWRMDQLGNWSRSRALPDPWVLAAASSASTMARSASATWSTRFRAAAPAPCGVTTSTRTPGARSQRFRMSRSTIRLTAARPAAASPRCGRRTST